ncbi:hypothetical protein HanPSC8_Chr02g0052111 [Helianthus annuus]|nr:hypothetical protein HanHA89_Chr02g0046521 [Helianthus annuus]KAJ0950771.1 hypothetical protein HanPSC8_Chr02g0052111 [Helianthus annuus]
MSNRSSHKSFFMPMLCRFSLNDTVKPPKLTHPSPSDPSSPKLTCIGQIKKRSTTTTTTTNHHHHHHSNRYTKLNKLFSSKHLISPAIDKTCINKLNSKSVTNEKCSINNFKSTSVTKRSKSCNGRNKVPINKKKYYINEQDIMKVVVDKELDPPLPVVKCHRRDQESNMNLWKRRGFEMKSLQIQPIQVTLNQNVKDNNGGFALSTSAATF